MSILKQIYSSLLVASACSIAVTPAHAQTGEVQRGHDLFLANGCYLCHGTVGQGGVAGPHIAVDLLPYVAVASYVRNASGRMPPFSEKILSDADLRAIYAYLGSVPKPRSPDSIPLLPKVEVGATK